MRRGAVIFAWLSVVTLATCTAEKLVIPLDGTGGSTLSGTGGAPASGGKGGQITSSTGGATTLGSGGATTPGNGGEFGGGGMFGGGGAGGHGARGGIGGGNPNQGGRNGGNGNGMGGRSVGCNGKGIDAKIQRPQVLISLSKNASMKTPFGPSDRLTEVQKALQKVVSNQPAIEFGIQEMPSASPCADACGCVDKMRVLYPAPNIGQSILSRLSPCSAGGTMTGNCATTIESRPLAAALTNAISLFPPVSPDAGKYVTRYLLLIADGDPSCGTMDAAGLCASAQQQLAMYADKRILAKVLAVSTDAQNTGCLGQLASQTGMPLISAGDPSQLTQKLSEFISEVAVGACTLTLTIPSTIRVDSIDPRLLLVSINGEVIEQDVINGWQYMASVPRIVFQGTSCAKVQKIQRDYDIDITLCSGQ